MYRRFGLIVLGAIFLVAVIEVRPIPANPKGSRFLEGAVVGMPVLAVMRKSCQDCHSNQTQWPWWAHFAPLGKVVREDVEKGRRFMNFSRWGEYSRGQKMGYLTIITGALQKDRMPPGRYKMLHPDATLSTSDRALLLNWAKEERMRLKAASQNKRN